MIGGNGNNGNGARGHKKLRVAGLFSGIGGLELGLHRAGHETHLLCEIDPPARAVLENRFSDIELVDDIRTIEKLPNGTDALAAGFPCQDLSQAGRTAGLNGKSSGLVGEVFRLLEHRRVTWVLLENVPFMMQLNRGHALEVIIGRLERLGYRWAYRIVDSRAFGLPQRRRRVFLLASLGDDPREVLFADDVGEIEAATNWRNVACGFYWTEGWRGLGWAVDCIPTLKGGSAVGIPSPPAIVRMNREVRQPDIRDAERLQGFRAGWTKAAEEVARAGHRWRLVGNAVTVEVAEWIGRRLAAPKPVTLTETPIELGASWPDAAWGDATGRYAVSASAWPVRRKQRALEEFLRFDGRLLSAKATAGFLDRARSDRATIRCEPGFLTLLDRHHRRMMKTNGR